VAELAEEESLSTPGKDRKTRGQAAQEKVNRSTGHTHTHTHTDRQRTTRYRE